LLTSSLIMIPYNITLFTGNIEYAAYLKQLVKAPLKTRYDGEIQL